MKFKLSKIALLVIGLSSSTLLMANELNVTVADIDTALTNQTLQQAWLTGATAPTRTVYEGWVRGCDANTNTIFSTQSATNSVPPSVVPGSIGNYSAYACKRAGIISVLYHTLDGGSLNAYTPHSISTALARVKFVGTGNGCTNLQSPLNYVDPTNSLNNAVIYKGCSQIGVNIPAAGPSISSNATTNLALANDVNAPRWPVGGYSDVEAALFSAAIGGGNVSRVGDESDVGVGQVFTVATSIPLYRAMQVSQGITGLTSETQDLPENAPNITSSQYAALISPGGDANWFPILGDDDPTTINKTLIVARRVDTSGTQSSSNAFFLRNPCANATSASLPPRTTLLNTVVTVVGQPDNVTITENSGTGNVKTQLTSASNNGNAALQYAIGVMSAENDWRTDSAANAGYRFLKIDGVHPETGDITNARVTATNGSYKFHMELKQFIRRNYDGQATKTAFENAIITQISDQLRNPPSETCSVFPRGLTLNPANGSSCIIGVQVAKMTNGGNNCATPIQFFK